MSEPRRNSELLLAQGYLDKASQRLPFNLFRRGVHEELSRLIESAQALIVQLYHFKPAPLPLITSAKELCLDISAINNTHGTSVETMMDKERYHLNKQLQTLWKEWEPIKQRNKENRERAMTRVSIDSNDNDRHLSTRIELGSGTTRDHVESFEMLNLTGPGAAHPIGSSLNHMTRRSARRYYETSGNVVAGYS
ncbi:hypothetical protein OIO90_006190 [Microbotryomycetes sp. JL221]|nr:hypothetical protein OIO90_006190 [Microbotryomycetes sp. JL221]